MQDRILFASFILALTALAALPWITLLYVTLK